MLPNSHFRYLPEEWWGSPKTMINLYWIHNMFDGKCCVKAVKAVPGKSWVEWIWREEKRPDPRRVPTLLFQAWSPTQNDFQAAFICKSRRRRPTWSSAISTTLLPHQNHSTNSIRIFEGEREVYNIIGTFLINNKMKVFVIVIFQYFLIPKRKKSVIGTK